MIRSVVLLCFAVPALADQVTDAQLIEALKNVNHSRREIANQELKAAQKRVGNLDLTSMDVELRNQLGDDWIVRKSGEGFLLTRVTPRDADGELKQKLRAQIREARQQFREVQVLRDKEGVTLRGKIDDCADAASGANSFARIDGVNRIFLDISCAENQ